MPRPNPELVPYGPMTWTRTYDSGTVQSGVIDPAVVNDMYRYRRRWSGSVTPGWKSLDRRARAQTQTLAFSCDILTSSGTPYTENLRNVSIVPPNAGSVIGSYVYKYPNTIIYSQAPSIAHLEEAYTKARAQLAGKVNDLHVNLGEAFAERRQTANLLTSTASRIASAALALKRGRLGDFATALSIEKLGKAEAKRVLKTPVTKRLSQHWLEYKYGWQPLLQDAYGAAELLSQHAREDGVSYSSTGKGTAREQSYVNSPPAPYIRESMQLVKSSVHIGVTYRLDDESRAGLASTGLSNPALLAWELLPYSFVVDWFVPVGGFLQALDAFSGFTFRDGYVVRFSKKQYQLTCMGNEYVENFGTYKTYRSEQGSCTYELVKFDRVRLDSFPSVGLPYFKNPLGGEPLNRLATATALLRVLFK
jgi:hypothetical protein